MGVTSWQHLIQNRFLILVRLLNIEIGKDLLLDNLPARIEGKGYVSVSESSFVWKESERVEGKKL